MPDGRCFQSYTAIRGQGTDAPALEVLDAGGEPRLRLSRDISLDPSQAFNAEGNTEAELVVIGNTKRTVMEAGILLMLDPEERLQMPWHVPPPYSAVLRLVPDDELAHNDQPPLLDRGRYLHIESLPSFPNLLIGESAARQLLAQAGVDLEELQAAMEAGEQVVLHTGLQVQLTYGLVYEEVPATNVVGYIPSLDMESRGERILVAATYTGSPRWDGVVYPGADENASGVAVMLETARLLHDLELIPKRTVVFAAFDEWIRGRKLSRGASRLADHTVGCLDGGDPPRSGGRRTALGPVGSGDWPGPRLRPERPPLQGTHAGTG